MMKLLTTFALIGSLSLFAGAGTARAATCHTPTVWMHSDTSPSGGGNITIYWDPISQQVPPRLYTVERQNADLSWSLVRGPSANKMYWGADLPHDALFRITTVGGATTIGACSPAGTPAVIDPGG
jgi:hypothetical protein